MGRIQADFSDNGVSKEHIESVNCGEVNTRNAIQMRPQVEGGLVAVGPFLCLGHFCASSMI